MTHKNHKPSTPDPEILALLQKSNMRLQATPLSALLQQPDRFSRFSRRLPGLLLDFTRVHIDDEVQKLLLQLAQAAGVEAHREALFAGQAVNVTEQRPALHMALRSPDVLQQVGGDEAARVSAAMQQMLALAGQLHTGTLPGGGGPVTDIVHVGIGGSLLGTQLLSEALTPPGSRLQVHFLGSVDAHRREALLAALDPATTLVVLVSKSFTTGDTLLHGRRLRAWLQQALGEQGARQRLYAVTSQVQRAEAFGINSDQMLYFSDWVGGRYSLWSPVSLSAAARFGPQRFEELLQGAAQMDAHFRQAPMADNWPVLLALNSIWHRNVCGYQAWGVMPYDQRLRLLPAYLQQLVMESNGKSVTVAGQATSVATSPVVFGETGTEAQHSVFQALHQGSDIVPLNFIGILQPDHDDREAHDELLANLLAQLTALATGRSSEDTRRELAAGQEALLPHRSFAGNRPSELLMLERLDARSLGMLLALYEHKVFVESVLWGINAFDQWGVELGKTLAPAIQQALAQGSSTSSCASLSALLAHVARQRGR
jgi:glucose-6-phosphate isomerase